MTSPACIKDVQRLTGKLTALSRSLGASAERAIPFFNIMKKGITFEWTQECEEAFNHFKKILSEPPKTRSSILYQQNTSRGRDEVYQIGKASLRPTNFIKKAKTILPRAYNHSENRPSHLTSPPKTRPSGKNDGMGSGAIPI
ncbi:uncharacterized protein LOC107472282 [Arachis duranensis]|uniref:Uncharacterized protein LOC107472282 n=1 Tax=Arachis duranensis TaxID=130453 RepID=A0A6P4BWD3_ARADU|nr:uncharacterized protein LOC107472282 [Arachis duranensis]